MELMLMGRYRLLIIKIFGELDQHKASSKCGQGTWQNGGG